MTHTVSTIYSAPNQQNGENLPFTTNIKWSLPGFLRGPWPEEVSLSTAFLTSASQTVFRSTDPAEKKVHKANWVTRAKLDFGAHALLQLAKRMPWLLCISWKGLCALQVILKRKGGTTWQSSEKKMGLYAAFGSEKTKEKGSACLRSCVRDNVCNRWRSVALQRSASEAFTSSTKWTIPRKDTYVHLFPPPFTSETDGATGNACTRICASSTVVWPVSDIINQVVDWPS